MTTDEQEVIDTWKGATDEEINEMYEDLREEVREKLEKHKDKEHPAHHFEASLAVKYDVPRKQVWQIISEERED